MSPIKRSDRKPRPLSFTELQRIDALRLVPEPSLEQLAHASRCRSYEAGEEVDQNAGIEEPMVLGVLEGRLELFFRSADGKEMPILELAEGDVAHLCDEGWAAPDETVLSVVSAKAVVWFAPFATFQVAVGKVAAMFFRRCHDWLREVGGLASDGMHCPRARICHTLWRDAQYSGSDGIARTHERLAARSCTERAKTTRVIGELRREGVIEMLQHPRRIVVLDPDRLAEE